MKKILGTVALATTAVLFGISPATAAAIDGSWSTRGTGPAATLESSVYEVKVGPDGLTYATGCFSDAGDDPTADVVAVWDGTAWSGLGDDTFGDGFFTNGCGWGLDWDSDGNLILGGSNLHYADSNNSQVLFKWDGTNWTNLALDKFTNGDGLRDIAVDSNNVIYWAGPTSNVDGDANLDFFGKLSGGTLSAVGQGFNDHVMAIEIDSSDNVYVGGKFTDAGGVSEADAVAKWNGTAWTALDSDGAGDGYFQELGNYSVVNDISLVDGTLYIAANDFNTIDGSSLQGVWKFNGTDIDPLFDTTWLDNNVRSLGYDSLNDRVLVAGWFSDVNGIDEADGIFGYDLDTSSVVTYDRGDRDTDGFTVHYLGNGAFAYGGQFDELSGLSSLDNLAQWDGTEWVEYGHTDDGAINGDVYDAQVGPDGNLYITGEFTNAGGDPTADRIAMWDGTNWVGLGDNGSGEGFFNTGDGFAIRWAPNGNLILGGNNLRSYTDNNNQSLFEWDGTEWTNLAQDDLTNGGGIRDIVVNTDGSMYLAGPFVNASDDSDLDYLVLFDDGVFTPVGDDGSGGPAFQDHVLALDVDESGNLYAAGKFTNAAGVAEADSVAKWNGQSWSALDSDGANNGYFSRAGGNSNIRDIKWANGKLYIAANYYDTPDGSELTGVWEWDGSTLSELIDASFNDFIRGLGYDYDKNRLLISGWFYNFGDNPVADGLIGVNLTTNEVDTFGEHIYDGDTEAEAFDRDGNGETVLYIGDGDIVYGGGFYDRYEDVLADNLLVWDGPDVPVNLAATGTDSAALLTGIGITALALGVVARRRRVN